MSMKTDTQIQQGVLAELQWEPSVDAADIGVEVKNGVVTLAGHVNSYAEKVHAQCAAQRVAGVKALAVEMSVKLAGPSKRTDAEIATAAEQALQWTALLPESRIKLMVEKGVITLTGDVDWDYQRKSASSAVRYLKGVVSVDDQILLKPEVVVSAVKAEVEAALQRRAHTDSAAVTVSVNGTAVTLTGKLHSWSERELATSAAWGTPGVYSVVDDIELL